jgi:hypothetical protein
MKFILAFSFIAAAAVMVTPQIDDAPTPTPLPFTAQPRQLEWRIGFDLGNAVILEAPELNPENDERSECKPDRAQPLCNVKLAVREAERLLPSPPLEFGLALLPASKVTTRAGALVNPRQWTILDLKGKTDRKTFQALGVFMGRRMTSTEGGYHLVSVQSMPITPFLGLRREPAPEDLIVGFAGPLKGKPQIHTKLSETKWEKSLPVEDPANLPPGYLSAKQLLDDHSSGAEREPDRAKPQDGQQRFLYGTSIEALIRNRLSKLWLLNYSHPDTTIGTHPWGIFVEEAGGLQPLYIYKPPDSGDPYVAYFTAAVDLNQDGTDELVIEASYRLGTAYKVISNAGGKYQETFASYYRGQEN